ncbi:hypothetical protein Tco_0216413 [Tanacetum coccineum]
MLVWGEADSETSPKKESRRKACKDMLHDLRGEVIQLMITTMVPRTSQDKEEQAGGTSFKELERQKTHLQALVSRTLMSLYFVVFVLDRNINNGNGNGNRNDNGNGSHDTGDGSKRSLYTARGCTYKEFLSCQPLNFKGTEGAVGLTHWFEKIEFVFHISNCVVKCQVKYATCTLLSGALTWWNSHVRTIGHDAA